MPEWTLRRFTKISHLRTIDGSLLYRFLAPYRTYWKSADVKFPDHPPIDDAVHTALVRAFMAPRHDIPGDLVRALHLLDDLSTATEMDALLPDLPLERLGVTSGSVTPGEYMILAWLHDRSRVERHYAEATLTTKRSYMTFPAATPAALTIRALTPSEKAAAERPLNEAFRSRNRGLGATIEWFPREDGIMVRFRHGDPLKRAEAIRDGQDDAVCYRPAKYDLAFAPADGSELQVAARSQWERELYRGVMGQLLRGDPNAYVASPTYSLTPLRAAGEALLTTAMVEGLASVELRRIVFQSRGEPSLHHTVKSQDSEFLVTWLHEGEGQHAELLEAEFRFRVEDDAKSQTVTIRPPDRISYSCGDDHGIIDQWFQTKGFFERHVEAPHDRAPQAVAKSRRVSHASGRPKRVA